MSSLKYNDYIPLWFPKNNENEKEVYEKITKTYSFSKQAALQGDFDHFVINTEKKNVLSHVQMRYGFSINRKKKKYVGVLRLVGLYMLEKPTNFNFYSQEWVIDHKDENPQNNSLNNLQWITRKENSRKSGLNRKGQTSKRANIKITDTPEFAKSCRGKIFSSYIAAAKYIKETFNLKDFNAYVATTQWCSRKRPYLKDWMACQIEPPAYFGENTFNLYPEFKGSIKGVTKCGQVVYSNNYHTKGYKMNYNDGRKRPYRRVGIKKKMWRIHVLVAIAKFKIKPKTYKEFKMKKMVVMHNDEIEDRLDEDGCEKNHWDHIIGFGTASENASSRDRKKK